MSYVFQSTRNFRDPHPQIHSNNARLAKPALPHCDTALLLPGACTGHFYCHRGFQGWLGGPPIGPSPVSYLADHSPPMISKSF